TPPTSLNPVISRDGRWVAYTVTTDPSGAGGGPGDGYVISADGGAPHKVCETCVLLQWLSDDRRVVFAPKGSPLSIIDLETGGRSPVLSVTSGGRESVSPDQRWIAFNRQGHILLAPFRPGDPPSESEWITLTTAESAERPCGWSPDSRLLYLLLQRD